MTAYKAKLVKDKVKNPKRGAFKPIKFVTSNCSNGECNIIFEINMILKKGNDINEHISFIRYKYKIKNKWKQGKNS